MLQYQYSQRHGHGQWQCIACEVLQDYTSQHGRVANSSIIRDHKNQQVKIVKMPSTSDMPCQDIEMTNQIPKDEEHHIGDPNEMDSMDNDNSEVEGSYPSKVQLSLKKKRRRRRKGTPGAPSVKGRDLDTFFPKMKKWISRHASTQSFLPRTIRFDNLDLTLTYYWKEALSFLVPLAEWVLPEKPKTEKERNKWHRRLMFKQRAQQILRERLKSNQALPI